MNTTDQRVQADVMNELKWEPSIDAAHIGVSAKDNAVTLSGHVPSYFAKNRAVHAAERVYAVRAVADDLEVQLPSSHPHDDAAIAEAIAANFKWNVAVPHDVDATVDNGWVTLTGAVDWNFQRDAAADAVGWHAGIRGVTNLIEVKKRANSGDVEKLINSAFQRNAILDARRVRVTTSGSTVSLYGNVHSVDEMRTARHAAYAAPGVTAVDSHLVVSP
jgi:osmotically-inducible protein OsmY